MKDREIKIVVAHVYTLRDYASHFLCLFLLSGEYMLACSPDKGSRLQRVILFFFVFSRFCSLTFFFLFEQNILFSDAHAHMHT